jgi:hypothetical protein
MAPDNSGSRLFVRAWCLVLLLCASAALLPLQVEAVS